MTEQIFKTKRFVLGMMVAGLLLASGQLFAVNGQRDPFELPSWKKPKAPASVGKDGKPAAPAVVPVTIAPVEARIAHFKRLREEAANAGAPLPKVTSVMTLDELAVTGIFKTPRGYAAMVEVKPIKLSYAVYPGERFFDGQLVAIEENRLVFRKVTKMSSGKFISSVETKSLRQSTQDQDVQGTAPAGSDAAKNEGSEPAMVSPASLVSPLEEMNQQKSGAGSSQTPEKRKSSRRPAKVAGVRR